MKKYIVTLAEVGFTGFEACNLITSANLNKAEVSLSDIAAFIRLIRLKYPVSLANLKISETENTLIVMEDGETENYRIEEREMWPYKV